jgi:hypothetical protein
MLKRLDCVFKISPTTLHSTMNTIGTFKKINKHGLLIIVTTSKEV